MTGEYDLTLMLVTDQVMTARRGLIPTLLAAVSGGVTIVQLRDKQADGPALTRIAAELRDALRPTGVPLIVNDRPAVAHAAGAAGVHIGQDDGDPASARAILGRGALIGLSVTDERHLAGIDPTVVDYIGLGPIHASATKADAAPALGVEAATAIGARLTIPFIAIGGITADNAAQAIRAGAAGVAVVSAICAAENPRAAARAIRNAVEKAR